jgi:PAS domain S-box-containing protein
LPADASELPTVARLGVAVGAALLALAINLSLADLTRGNTGPIFLSAVIGATWFGGFWPGVLAVILTAAGNLYYIAVHDAGVSLTAVSTVIRVGLLMGISLAAAAIITALRRVGAEARATARTVEAREIALRASELRFRGLLDAAPDAMVIVDREGRIVLANRQAQLVFGYDASELLGRPIEVLVPETYRAGHVHQRDRYIASPRTRPMGAGIDLYARRQDGSEFPVEISLSPMETPEGLLITAAVRDITGRKHVEAHVHALNENLQRRVAELAAVNRELEAFSYSVSHDLRAPLRSIDGFSQAILEEYEDKLDEQGQDYLRRVRAAAKRMGELIDDLLNLSRVTRREMRRETVDLSVLAATVAAQLERSKLYRPVQFIVAPGLTVSGDPHLLRIVLDNLFGNAWKFTGQNPSPRVEFGAKRLASGERAFFVSDNGVGFDMAHAEKLFGAFQRLHAMHEFPGTGIGLATVQRIINRHGGRVWAEATPGHGATFYFTLEAKP